MLIRCLLLSVWRKSRPAQFFPSPSTNITDVGKFEVGKKTDRVGKKLTGYFFLPGKKWLDSFFPGEEMGRPDPSPGKDWRGGKTDRYTGSELVTSHSPKQTLYRATEAGKRYYTQVIIDENIL